MPFSDYKILRPRVELGYFEIINNKYAHSLNPERRKLELDGSHGRKSWGGRGGRVPPTFWSGGDTYINCPPHFLSGLDSSIVVLKYCFNTFTRIK